MLRTSSASRPPRFLGRERELEQIRAGVEAAVDGRGGFLSFSAQPGMGLTSLAREAASRATAAGVAVTWGTCLPGTIGRPYAGLADALERYARSRPAAEVVADLAGDAGPILRLCPALTPLVPSLAPAAPLDAPDERMRVYEAIAGWIRRMAARVPLMVVIDNGADAGDDLAGLMGHLTRRLHDARVLILWLTRVGGEVGLAGVDVGPLDDGAMASLLADRSADPIAPAVGSLINDVSGGNPLVAIQLFELLIEQGASAAGANLPSRSSLPAALDEIVAWRVAPLTGDARKALDTVALMPQGAAPSLVGAVLGFGRSRVGVALETAAEHGFMDVDSDRAVYTVDQPAIRTAIEGLVAHQAPARLHRAIAMGIEEDEPDRLRERAGELCYHWARSASTGGGPRGVHFALLTAEQARAAYAHRRAADCIESALALAPESDQDLKLDLLGRLAGTQAVAGLREEALASAAKLFAQTPGSAPIPSAVFGSVIDTLRTLRGRGMPWDQTTEADELRVATLARAIRADPLVRARLELLGERWALSSTAGVSTEVWSQIDPVAAKALLDGDNEVDGGEVMLVQRPRTQVETAVAIEKANGWRRPQSVLRAMHCVAADLVWRHGMFREGVARASEYLAAAVRYGSHRDRAAAGLLLARARAALGEFAAADDDLLTAANVMPSIGLVTDLLDEMRVAEAALAYYRDGEWAVPGHIADPTGQPARPGPPGLLFSAITTLAAVRLQREVEARAAIPNVLDAIAQQSPLTLYREPALTVALAAIWELGAAEHAGVGRSLVELATEGGAGGQIESSLPHARARMLSLSGDLPAARDIFANERPQLDRAGQRPLRALVDFDEAIAIAAAGKDGYVEATRLLETAASQFEQLGMHGWHKRAKDLLAQGLSAASGPGGRLAFTFPRGLTRREADVVRLLAAGATTELAAATLVMEPQAVERLVGSALEKLGAERPDELPRLARRYGLGGV